MTGPLLEKQTVQCWKELSMCESWRRWETGIVRVDGQKTTVDDITEGVPGEVREERSNGNVDPGGKTQSFGMHGKQSQNKDP